MVTFLNPIFAGLIHYPSIYLSTKLGLQNYMESEVITLFMFWLLVAMRKQVATEIFSQLLKLILFFLTALVSFEKLTEKYLNDPFSLLVPQGITLFRRAVFLRFFDATAEKNLSIESKDICM